MTRFSIAILFVIASFAANAQTLDLDFGSASTGDVPAWLTETGDNITLDGKEYPVYKNNKCGYAIHLRGKYFVYVSDTDGIGETEYNGKTYKVFETCKGSKFIFVKGAKGLYAKYAKKSKSDS